MSSPEEPTAIYKGKPVSVAVGRRDVVQLPPRIFRARLKGMLFDTMRTFLLPEALNSIRRLKRYYDQHPGAEVLVVGHADTSGDDRYNLKLSRERAEAVAAYLQDDVEHWLAWYKYVNAPFESTPKRWDTREDKHMLSALNDHAGPFYRGEIDRRAETEETREAFRRFQEWTNARLGTSLPVTGRTSDDTRRELIRAYMAEDGTTLPEGTILKVHGCGEYHPEVATGDGVSEAENRRVEVYLFETAIDPPPQDECPGPDGCAEYEQWVAGTTETVDLRDEDEEKERTFVLELLDDVQLPDDAALVVHGLDTPLRLEAKDHHDPDQGLYAFSIYDPPPGALCRATLVCAKATLCLFDEVDLHAYIEQALSLDKPPHLPIELPGAAFDETPPDEEEEEDYPEELFEQDYEGLLDDGLLEEDPGEAEPVELDDEEDDDETWGN